MKDQENENELCVLQIEHPVQSIETWKMTFDQDPAQRQQSGVIYYSVLNLTDNANYVQINLTFKNLIRAEEFHSKMKKLWLQVDGKLIHGPQARIYKIIEEKRLATIL